MIRALFFREDVAGAHPCGTTALNGARARACRGQKDAAKRDEALAAKYLRPLTPDSARIEFRPKTPKPAVEGIKAVYTSAEITRVTPPRGGTSVYPNGNWQLPG